MKKLWFAFVLVFVVPPTLHFIVNLYWWLFDGNVLNGDKMGASGMMAFVTNFIAGAWAGEGKIFKGED